MATREPRMPVNCTRLGFSRNSKRARATVITGYRAVNETVGAASARAAAW
jgi:hypothetical protein